MQMLRKLSRFTTRQKEDTNSATRNVGKSIFYENEEKPPHKDSAMRKVGKSIFYENEEEEPEDDRSSLEKSRNEIIVTEAEYLGKLRVLTEAYIKPLALILTEPEAQQLFGNINEVIESSERLLGELCNSETMTEVYSVIENAASSYLHSYVAYCANLPTALALLARLIYERERFREQVLESEGNERGIGLQACLLKPFQRLTRLPLIISPLEKQGEPVAPVIAAITKLVEECNNSVVEQDCLKLSQEAEGCRRSSSFYVNLQG